NTLSLTEDHTLSLHDALPILHPHYRETVETLSGMSDHAVVALTPSPRGGEGIAAAIDSETSCVVVQTPDVYGHLHDLRPIVQMPDRKSTRLNSSHVEISYAVF